MVPRDMHADMPCSCTTAQSWQLTRTSGVTAQSLSFRFCTSDSSSVWFFPVRTIIFSLELEDHTASVIGQLYMCVHVHVNMRINFVLSFFFLSIIWQSIFQTQRIRNCDDCTIVNHATCMFLFTSEIFRLWSYSSLATCCTRGFITNPHAFLFCVVSMAT